jgi:carboxymethylenebutenolidase
MRDDALMEQEIEVNAPDGSMTTWIYHPAHDGPHPVILYLMDAPGVRPGLREMAARLASAGYYVMLPNLYYRSGPYRELTRSDEDMHRMGDLMKTVTRANIIGDAEALLKVADADPAASSGPIGTVGFCMSGGLVIALAKAMPDRVKAVASIHGAWLVLDDEDSPHRGLQSVTAEVYMAWCDKDETAPAETIPVMRQALEKAGVSHTIDFLTEALHGYAPPGSPRYNRDASELHWERVHSLFRRNLQSVTV